MSTKEQSSQSARPQIINNQYYGSSSIEDDVSISSQDNNVYLSNKFQVPDQAVMVSSPSSLTVHVSPGSSEESNYQLIPSQSQSYSPELPSGMKNQTSGEASASQSTVSLPNIVTKIRI